MAKEVTFTERFKKNYRDLPESIQTAFDKQLGFFMGNPSHPSLKIHRYKSEKGIWEGYVTDKYRFTFMNLKETYIFRNIGPHGIIDKGRV